MSLTNSFQSAVSSQQSAVSSQQSILNKLLMSAVFSFVVLSSQAQYWENDLNDQTPLDPAPQLGTLYDLPLNFFTNSLQKMTISNHPVARVGIGTATPNYNLHIHGEGIAAFDDKGIPIQGTTSSESALQFTNATSGTGPTDGFRIGVLDDQIYMSSVDHLRMKILNGSAFMILDGGGRINMFGESNMINSRFNLFAGQEDGMTINRNGGENKFGLRILTSSGASNNAIEVKQSGNIAYVIKNDGRVGIGTGTPDAAYKLDVAGKVRACDVRVNNSNNWCDYVFSDAYKLMPLAELEQYIALHHHLPEMLSEKEVNAQGGFDLALMSTSLLKRSEENTLYILELENQLSKTRAKNSELEQRLAKLELKMEKVVSSIEKQ